MVVEMSKTRAERVEALEEWANNVDSTDLRVADTTALREIAKLADQRNEVEAELAAAVWSARRARRSWSEIGAMLGVSKQAAQRKYASKTSP
jgi:Fic family protein